MSPVMERAARVRFRRALSLMVLTLFAPGSAQFLLGNRKAGKIALTIWASAWGLFLVSILVMLVHRDFGYWMATNTTLLLFIRLGLLLGAVGWAALFVDAWRLGQPLSYGMAHRRMAIGVNGVLCFAVAGTMLFGAHMVAVQRDFIIAMFGDGKVTGAHDGRFNVLLLGGDSGAGRWGLRPDSMTVASIDANTGRTVLIALPRNMANFPFAEGSVMDKQFPKGFNCEGCYLNGVSTWAGDHTDLFKGSKNPGIDATMSAIEGITDLKINYWAMVNLEGFKDLVDAVGGITLNVRDRIPVGGLGSDVTGYIEPGTRKLNGHDTLWYARAREGSDDYSRMARQKCVMNAMLKQLSPQTVVTKFEDIAKASTELISTSLPASELDRFMSLAMKAKGQKISTLSLVPPMINTADPDIDLIHDKVDEAIDRAEGNAPASKTSKKSGKKAGSQSAGDEPVTGGAKGTLKEGYQANESEDLTEAC